MRHLNTDQLTIELMESAARTDVPLFPGTASRQRFDLRSRRHQLAGQLSANRCANTTRIRRDDTPSKHASPSK